LLIQIFFIKNGELKSLRLLIVILSTFLLPWAVGLIFFFKDKKIFVTIAPFAAVLAYVLNTIGIDLGLFYPLPVEYLKTHTVTIFPNIGWYPVKSCMFIYLVVHTKIKPIVLNIIITGIGTLTDLIFISTKFLGYGKEWNYMISILMFLISFSIIYLYYLWLKKLDIL
jgi:hypothetical protein